MLILVAALVASLFAPSAIHGQSVSDEPGKFEVEIQSEARGGPKFRVTNLSSKVVTACVFQLSVSTESRPQSQIVWDAIVYGELGPRRGEQPLDPAASMMMHLFHEVDGPFPDKVEIVAAVWDDGTTFGEQKWLKLIFDQRALMVSAYDQAIAILQKGLDENWTGSQYLAAVNANPDSVPLHSIRRTLQVNPEMGEEPIALQRVIQELVAAFSRKLATLREAKPPVGAVSALIWSDSR